MAQYDYITSTGTILPDTAETLSVIQSEFKGALGDDLIVDPSSPQGVLITAETLARDAILRNNAALANQINPNLAGGTFIDAICALTGLERVKAERSILVAQVAGVAGTSIPEGVRAKTLSEDFFESTATVIIGVDGLGLMPMRSVEFGAIGAPVNSLNQIVDGVLGWDTVINLVPAILGRAEQSDQSLRAKRKLTLALQGISLPEAIISALYDTDGVKSLAFRENTAATTQTIDGISMISHSIYVCVDGGSNADVGAALLENKSGGAGWNGGTTVTVIDAYSGQPYVVKFDRPTAVPIMIRTTVKTNSLLIDPQVAVKSAILQYVNGDLEGEPGFTVGTSVSVFELAGAINRVTPGIYVQTIEVSDDAGATWGTAEIPIGINQIATTNGPSIAVTAI